MRPLSRVTWLSTVTVACLLSGYARPIGAAGPASYAVTNLNPSPSTGGMWPAAVNDSGTVVGTLSRNRHAFIELGKRLVDLGSTNGLKYYAALGVSSSGTVLIRAFKTPDKLSYFVVTDAGSKARWVRLRSGVKQYAWPQASQIDGEGDLIGTVRRAGSGNSARSLRTAVWLAQSKPAYHRATLLANAPGFTAGKGIAIWNRGQRVVAAGCSFAEKTMSDCTTFWLGTPQGKFHVSQSAEDSGTIEYLGGSWGHLYAAVDRCDGYDFCNGFAGRVTFHSGTGQVVTPVDFPAPPDSGLIWGLSGVTAGPDWKPLAIGTSGIGPTPEPPIWKNGHVYTLQSQLATHTKWTLDTANALSESGFIVGTGRLNGHNHAYLMTPLGCGDKSCY